MSRMPKTSVVFLPLLFGILEGSLLYKAAQEKSERDQARKGDQIAWSGRKGFA